MNQRIAQSEPTPRAALGGSVRGAGAVALRLALLLALSLAAPRARTQDEVLEIVSSFSQKGPIVYWGWPNSIKTNAIAYSWRTNVWDADAGRMVHSLTIADDFPWQWTSGSSIQTADAFSAYSATLWDYLSPEADEVRVRLKVVSGRFHLALGCINLAFTPSDTFTDIRVVDDSMPGWQTVRFSLHKDLIRNYRRNAFTKQLPFVSIARWIQEPLQLYLFRAGAGQLLIERVELANTGLGRSYPNPPASLVTPVATVADFERTNDLGLTFTYTTVPLDLAGPQPTNYVKTSQNSSGTIMVAGKKIQWFLPPALAWVEESSNGAGSLEVKQTGYESFAFTGLRLPNPEAANAVQLTLRADHNSTLTGLVLDFLAYAAPEAARAAFPWTNCQTPSAWRAETNLNFDLFLAEENTVQESYALYHARRTVPNHQWTRVLLPLDDFAGIYACNDGTNVLQSYQPLRSTDLLFLSFFSPYRQLKAETRICLDDVALVRVDLPSEQLRSFWQDPQRAQAQLIPLADYPSYYGHFRQRDQPLGPLTLDLSRQANSMTVLVSGPAEQRYEVLASEDLQQWQPVFTGYVGSTMGVYQAPASWPARFYQAISE